MQKNTDLINADVSGGCQCITCLPCPRWQCWKHRMKHLNLHVSVSSNITLCLNLHTSVSSSITLCLNLHTSVSSSITLCLKRQTTMIWNTLLTFPSPCLLIHNIVLFTGCWNPIANKLALFFSLLFCLFQIIKKIRYRTLTSLPTTVTTDLLHTWFFSQHQKIPDFSKHHMATSINR